MLAQVEYVYKLFVYVWSKLHYKYMYSIILKELLKWYKSNMDILL